MSCSKYDASRSGSGRVCAEPGCGLDGAVVVPDGDPLHQELGVVDLDRVGDRQPELPAPHQRPPLRHRPLAGRDQAAEGALPLEGALVAGALHRAALGVGRGAVEGAVLGRAVPLGGHDHAAVRVVGVGALDEVDVGLLAGLEDAELGVDGALRGHHPVGAWLRSTAERLDAEPGRPPLVVAEVVVVGPEVEDEALVDVAQGVRRWDVTVGVGDEVVGKGPVRGAGVLREVVRHRWWCSMRCERGGLRAGRGQSMVTVASSRGAPGFVRRRTPGSPGVGSMVAGVPAPATGLTRSSPGVVCSTRAWLPA